MKSKATNRYLEGGDRAILKGKGIEKWRKGGRGKGVKIDSKCDMYTLRTANVY